MGIQHRALLILSALSYTLAIHTGMTRLEDKILSRERRFIIPDPSSDWTFTVKFTLKFPLEGLDTNFDGNVPFPFKFNVNE